MCDLENFHQLARRYCADRAQSQSVQYGMLIEIERFVPTDFLSVEEMREMLCLAVSNVAAEGMAEKQAVTRFLEFLKDLEPSQPVELLPYRRVLGQLEERRLVQALEARWGRWYGGDCDRAHSNDVVSIDQTETSIFEEPGSYDRMREVVARLENGARLYEINEWGPSYEQDVACSSFCKSESFCFPPGCDWMVYSSHESSLTLAGGALLQALTNFLGGLPLRLHTEGGESFAKGDGL